MLATVYLLFSLSEPSASDTPEVSKAEALAAVGEAHLKRATAAEHPLDELDSAHTKFDSAFLVDGATPYLCRALAVAELALRTATFVDEQERLSWEETRRDDLDRLRDDATQTGRVNCRFDAKGSPAPPRVALLEADDPSVNLPLPVPLVAPPSAARRGLPERSRGQVHRARAHTAMGAIFTGAGIGMLATVAGVLELERQRAGELRGLIQTAKAENRGFTPTEERRYYDLGNDLLQGRDVAIGVGVAGLVSLGTGVALLATRKKARSRTYALQPYGGPQGAGAVLRLRF